MSKPIVLQEDFSNGSAQDTPRHQLPAGKSWLLTDFIPSHAVLNGGNFVSPLVNRNGWARSSSVLAGSYVAGVGVAPYASFTKVLAVNNSGTLYWFNPASPGVSTSVGTVPIPAHPPTFYRDNAFFFDVNGSSAPQRYSGSALAAVGGSPPTASVSATYKDHLVAANASGNTTRIWFSSAGNPNAWDTAADGQWLDATAPVMGLASLRNMLLVFEQGQTERIRGDIIPGVVGSDMVREPLFRIGCSDPASIAVSDDYAIFANSSGIYLTDGIGVLNLVEQAGMLGYFRTQMFDYTSAWTISAGLLDGWYVFSVMNGSTFQFAGMIHVRKRVYIALTNVKAAMVAASPVGVPDLKPSLYMAERGSTWVSDLGNMFNDVNDADGDGTAVTPSLETPYYMGRPGKKRWKALYITYELLTTGSLTVTAQTNRQATNYTTTIGTLPTAALTSRVRLPIGKLAEGMQFKITQTGQSQATLIHTLEADMYPVESGRV